MNYRCALQCNFPMDLIMYKAECKFTYLVIKTNFPLGVPMNQFIIPPLEKWGLYWIHVCWSVGRSVCPSVRPSVSFPLNNLRTIQPMFMRLHTNVPYTKTMCCVHHSCPSDQGQGHGWGQGRFPFRSTTFKRLNRFS